MKTDQPRLSKRESQIMRLVAKGDTNTAIAATLGISPHTVDNHLRRVFLKTGAHCRTVAALRLSFDDPRQLSLPILSV